MRAPIQSYKVAINHNSSALGDSVCTLPAILRLLKDDALHLLCTSRDFLPVFDPFVPPEKLIVREEMTQEVQLTCELRHSFLPRPTSLRMHLVDYASVVLADTILLPEERKYPRLPPPRGFPPVTGNYMVIGTHYTLPPKRMRVDTLLAITELALSLRMTPVWVGKSYDIVCNIEGMRSTDSYTEDSPPPPGVVDLRNRTSLEELHALIAGARMVVSMDSGIVHWAALTDTPIIAGYTYKDPRFIMPIRDNVTAVVPPHGSCKFCMTQNVNPMQDFTFCARGDVQCASEIRTQDFLAAIEKEHGRREG